MVAVVIVIGIFLTFAATRLSGFALWCSAIVIWTVAQAATMTSGEFGIDAFAFTLLYGVLFGYWAVTFMAMFAHIGTTYAAWPNSVLVFLGLVFVAMTVILALLGSRPNGAALFEWHWLKLIGPPLLAVALLYCAKLLLMPFKQRPLLSP